MIAVPRMLYALAENIISSRIVGGYTPGCAEVLVNALTIHADLAEKRFGWFPDWVGHLPLYQSEE